MNILAIVVVGFWSDVLKTKKIHTTFWDKDIVLRTLEIDKQFFMGWILIDQITPFHIILLYPLALFDCSTPTYGIIDN
jgi:hypothetical protein